MSIKLNLFDESSEKDDEKSKLLYELSQDICHCSDDFIEAVEKTFNYYKAGVDQSPITKYVNNGMPIITTLGHISSILVSKEGYDSFKDLGYNSTLKASDYIILEPNQNLELVEPITGLKIFIKDFKQIVDPNIIKRHMQRCDAYLTIEPSKLQLDNHLISYVPYGLIKQQLVDEWKKNTIPKLVALEDYFNYLVTKSQESIEKYELEENLVENLDIKDEIQKAREKYKKNS